MSAGRGKRGRELAVGLGFIAPNIIGFLVFTLFPVLFTFAMAFTNWDIRLHNMFKDEAVRFAWFENFARLFSEKYFWKYLGNTLFLMLGLPLGIAGSLCAALLLHRDPAAGSRRVRRRLVMVSACLCLVFAGAMALLLAAGAVVTGMTVLISALACTVLLGGALGGKTVFRTLFYMPHFTAGVAVFVLWKKLYSPHTGPINHALRPLLDGLGAAVCAVPPAAVQAGLWLGAAGVVLVAVGGLRRVLRLWREGELGAWGLVVGTAVIAAPAALAPNWSANSLAGLVIAAAVMAALAATAGVGFVRGREFGCPAGNGLTHALVLGGLLMAAQLLLLGFGNVLWHLPAMARSADGLMPPEWLTRYHWAKPSLMIMGLWAAVGSNSMLLYLAGLSNIPPELYEAADIDGASGAQRFWHVTWPQLAPVTFFLVVMGMIRGLQGGFEMARTMTRGGPDGATTTLSYFIYVEGFETGRLGYASAVAWALFGLVFLVTLFNWKFGSRYVNE